MRVLRRVLVISAVIAVCSVAHVQAQFKPMAWEAGIGMGYNFGMTDQKDDATRFMGRAFVRRGLLDFLQIEAGGFASGIAGSSAVTETNYKTDFFGGDLRLLLMPYIGQSIVPYVYGGGGMLHYSIVEYTLETPTEFKRKDWVGYIPLGAGVLINWQQNTYFELSAGYNQSLSKELSGIKSATNDRFINFLFGVTVSFE